MPAERGPAQRIDAAAAGRDAAVPETDASVPAVDEVISADPVGIPPPPDVPSQAVPARHEAMPVLDLRQPLQRRKAETLRYWRSREQKRSAWETAARGGWEPRTVTDDATRELMAIRDGRVYVYKTLNVNAAISTTADRIRDTAPYDVNGAGQTIGLWDAGSARTTHVEFDGRVANVDDVGAHYHSTHVAGTMGAEGERASALGMAPAARIDSYDWNFDTFEMTSRAMAAAGESGKLQISNHSYGFVGGWDYGSVPLRWFGTWTNGVRECDAFGQYDAEAADWDALCYAAPYYLPFKSSGNDRSDNAPASGTSFEYYFDGDWVTAAYDPATHPRADNYDDGGYDTLMIIGNAKNILTVGAVKDASNDGVRDLSRAVMTPFSAWGPTDDGRIKPDIVANGNGLWSTMSYADDAYGSLSGTSMSSPNAAGSAALLCEYYNRLLPGQAMRSSALKALIMHTTDDLGNPGPDYQYGWGLMNSLAAAEIIRTHAAFPGGFFMRDGALGATNATDVYELTWDEAGPVRVTLCWTDPPGEGLAGLDNPSPRLVNDLDLRIVDPQGQTGYPYALDPLNPSAVATNGDNTLDNVEQIEIAQPIGGVYTVIVSHKGSLWSGTQAYSLVFDGSAAAPAISHAPIVNSPLSPTGYVAAAEITYLTELDTNSLWLVWRTNASPTWVTNALAPVSNDLYSAQIPSLPLSTRVEYFLEASATNGLRSTHPHGAPDQVHRFTVVLLAPLLVLGAPAEFGAPSPPYGLAQVPTGLTVEAYVDAFDYQAADFRYACTGWRGLGDVPAEGASNEVSFLFTRASSLEWQWEGQYSLVQDASLAGVLGTTTWWAVSSEASTVEADAGVTAGSTEHRFVEWQVDGVRRSDGLGVAVNPATGIVMSVSRAATAIYMSATMDEDEDGLGDWWELFYFGSLDAGPLGDPDADGYLNQEEFQDRTDPLRDGSMPEPPVLVHEPLADPQVTPAPWPVSAVVTDNNAVASVLLRWRRTGLNWRQVEMSAGSGPGEYEGVIPAPGILRDSFEYWIQATDEAGYVVDGPSLAFDVAYPVIGTDTNRFEVLLLAGEATNAPLVLGNTGNADLVWTTDVSAAPVPDDVEHGENGWTHEGLRDLWHISARRSSSPTQAWYCGDEETGRYQDKMDCFLVMPTVRLQPGARLTFRHWPDMELGSPGFAWDGGTVEISDDGGATFVQLDPEEGYPYTIQPNPASPFEPGTGVYAGQGGWRDAAFDLTAYGGSEVIIRFRMGTDEFVVDDGWYIDDIAIGPVPQSNAWLSVDPASGVTPPPQQTNLLVTFDSAGLPTGTNSTLFLRFISNDPNTPVHTVEALLRVRSVPEVGLPFAAQTATDGSGHVTISNVVYDADGEPCDVEFLYSTDGGASWTEAWVDAVAAATGTPTVTNGALPQVGGVLTLAGGGPVSNALSVTWATTNGVAPIVLHSGTLVRARAWDGNFWGAAVTSQPFLVDNEAPTAPVGPASSSHAPASWSTNPTVQLTWLPASDGGGGGVGGYAAALAADSGVPAPGVLMTTNLHYDVAAAHDGTNLWGLVRAVDVFGNAGPTAQAGPFWIDTQPPSASNAVITFTTSPWGNYSVGSGVAATWSGFTDNLSGVVAYRYASTDWGGTTNGTRTNAPAGRIPFSVPDATNAFHVWAEDRAGLLGDAAAAYLLVLDAGTDFDGDGLDTGDEEIAGTDAAEASSALRFSEAYGQTSTNGNDVVLRWQSVAGRLYSLDARTALAGGGVWAPLPDAQDLPGTGETMIYRCASGGTNPPARYFRLRVRLP